MGVYQCSNFCIVWKHPRICYLEILDSHEMSHAKDIKNSNYYFYKKLVTLELGIVGMPGSKSDFQTKVVL